MIRENQRSLERMALGEKCDPTKRKRFGRGSGERTAPSGLRCDKALVWRVAPGGVRCPPGGLELGSA